MGEVGSIDLQQLDSRALRHGQGRTGHRRAGRGRRRHDGEVPTIGTLTVISQLPTYLYGEVEGIGRVTITADGNMHGFSPVRFCVDEEGEVAWIPTDRIVMRDPRLQPVGTTLGTQESVSRARTKK